MPAIAHPPCRAWGRYKHVAKPRADEKELAVWSVETIRKCGGVLEHPATSDLFKSHLPQPGRRDDYGFTMGVFQSWWGHRAPKPTALYVVGVKPADIPPFPLVLGIPDGRIENMGRAERERTPATFARWLFELASKATP